MTLLAVTDLAKSFGTVAAVDGVSFALEAGERLAIIGPNGAGKTTCFNLVNGQIRPDRGRVAIDGADVTGSSPRALRARGVGRTFQISAVFGSMTVRENVQMALVAGEGRTLALWPATRGLSVAEADTALETVGLAEEGDRPAATLAYGDAKRLELAMALSQQPRLLLMDEPTAGMGEAERHGLMERVSALARARGIGVLFTEHDMDVVFGHADRIVVLHRGRVIAAGTPSAVRADPAVQDVYLGGVPA